MLWDLRAALGMWLCLFATGCADNDAMVDRDDEAAGGGGGGGGGAQGTAGSSSAGEGGSPNASFRIQSMKAGRGHTCALVNDGAVLCWGDNEYGQLGNGSTQESATPIQVLGLTQGVTALALGDSHSCALGEFGVRCWGNNEAGQLGNGKQTPRLSPVAVKGLETGVSTISADGAHSCAVQEGGVLCWGDLGGLTPEPVEGLEAGVTALAAGHWHDCAIQDGGVVCWGSNVDGQLGGPKGKAPVVSVEGLSAGVDAIAASNDYSCALAQGTVSCWGRYRDYVSIDDDTDYSTEQPKEIDGLSAPATDIAVGDFHGCARVGGAVECWGDNNHGQRGSGSGRRVDEAVPVAGVSGRVTGIATGSSHSCAWNESSAYCWGYNRTGQLGNNTVATQTEPVWAEELGREVTAISAGWWNTCALVDGQVRCLGYIDWSQPPASNTPAALKATAIDSGMDYNCALTDEGVFCFHDGDNTVTRVKGLSEPVTALEVGGYWGEEDVREACAVAGGVAYCWGYSYFDYYEGGRYEDDFETAVMIPGLTGEVTALAVGDSDVSCGLVDGAVYCWQPYFNGKEMTMTPTRLEALSGKVTALAAAGQEVCAVVDGAVLCLMLSWTDALTASVPVRVKGLPQGATAISVGAHHSCALVDDQVWCWSNKERSWSNFYGELGNGTRSPSPVPVAVKGLPKGVTAISVGLNHTCALASGSTYCWGSDLNGQLGTSAACTGPTPVQVLFPE